MNQDDLNFISREFPFELKQLLLYSIFSKYSLNVLDVSREFNQPQEELTTSIITFNYKFKVEIPYPDYDDWLFSLDTSNRLLEYSDLIYALCRGCFLALQDVKTGTLTLSEALSPKQLEERYTTMPKENRFIRKSILLIKFKPLISLLNLAYFDDYKEASKNLSMNINELKREILELEKIFKTKLIQVENQQIKLTVSGYVIWRFAIKILEVSRRIHYELDIEEKERDNFRFKTYAKFPFLPRAYDIFIFSFLIIIFKINFLPKIYIMLIIHLLKMFFDLQILPSFSISNKNTIKYVKSFRKSIIESIKYILNLIIVTFLDLIYRLTVIIVQILNVSVVPILIFFINILVYFSYPIRWKIGKRVNEIRGILWAWFLRIERAHNLRKLGVVKWNQRRREADIRDLTWRGTFKSACVPNPFDGEELIKRNGSFLPISVETYKKDIEKALYQRHKQEKNDKPKNFKAYKFRIFRYNITERLVTKLKSILLKTKSKVANKIPLQKYLKVHLKLVKKWLSNKII